MKDIDKRCIRKTVRFSDAEVFRLEQICNERCISFSDFVRGAALSLADGQPDGGGFLGRGRVPFELASHLCTAIALQIITATPLVEGLDDELESMVSKLMMDLGYVDADA